MTIILHPLLVDAILFGMASLSLLVLIWALRLTMLTNYLLLQEASIRQRELDRYKKQLAKYLTLSGITSKSLNQSEIDVTLVPPTK